MINPKINQNTVKKGHKINLSLNKLKLMISISSKNIWNDKWITLVVNMIYKKMMKRIKEKHSKHTKIGFKRNMKLI